MTTESESNPSCGTSLWTCAALTVALAALAGSLYMSMAMHLKACPLCMYQRTFIMGIVGILGIGVSVSGWRPGSVSLLALPLAAGSLGVVIFHVYLYETGRLECPKGLSGTLIAPEESLGAHILLILLLLFDVCRTKKESKIPCIAVAGALVMGGLFTFGAIKSAPPACKPDYSIPIDEDGCRKPQ